MGWYAAGGGGGGGWKLRGGLYSCTGVEYTETALGCCATATTVYHATGKFSSFITSSI